MWFLFQIAIMTLIIGSNGADHWAGSHCSFAVGLRPLPLAGFWLNDLFQLVLRKPDGWFQSDFVPWRAEP
jgi:hypothetical protein